MFSTHGNVTGTILLSILAGLITQSVASPTADPGVTSFISAWFHAFVEIDLEIIYTVISFLPLIQEGLHAGASDFRLYDGSDLKTYLLMRW